MTTNTMEGTIHLPTGD